MLPTGDDKIIEQVVKQLNRLIDTIKVVDLTGQTRVERELALITVYYQKGNRGSRLLMFAIFSEEMLLI